MNAHLYLAFVVTTTILVLVPGPVIALTVSHSVAHGSRRALATVAGATCSIIVQLIITALGIASILLLLSDWFEVLRWASVAYLIYLGIQQWRAPIRKSLHDATTTAGANRLFWQGFLVSSTNPKSLIFYAVFSRSSSTRPPRPSARSLCSPLPFWWFSALG